MKAVYIAEFSRDLRLELRDVEKPQIKKDSQVLVKVAAAGLNRADILQSAGHYPPPSGYSPNIPGLEFAGEVEDIGAHVEGIKCGDHVCGIVAGEGQAEYVVTEEKELLKVPAGLSLTEAAALPEAFMTAHDAVFVQAKAAAGETLLIHAVGSGVGLAALQIAKARGLRVIGTSRTKDKLDRCAQFGLDDGIVTEGEDFADKVLESTDGHGADVVLDLVGGKYFEQNLKSLAQKGRLMLVGLTSGRSSSFDLSIALQKRATIIGTTMRARSSAEKAAVTRAFADEVLPLIESKKVVPNVDRVFPARDVVEAYQYLTSNSSFGKVVLNFQ